MHENIVNAIKERYSRDLRKGVVKSMLEHEKSGDKEALESSYKVINQIFSYVMSELNWNLSSGTDSWDDTPLKIILETFPKIDETKWFEEKLLSVTKAVRLEGGF